MPESRPASASTRDADSASAPDTRRRLSHVFIAAFLGFQLFMPLSYYLGPRGYDERFSYRMFSTLRLRDCDVQVTEQPSSGASPRKVALERDVQVAWVKLLERNRTAVVERYLQRRCEQQPIDRVAYTRSCTDTDGTALPKEERSLRCTPREGAAR